ncbi:MAG TPA: hypothetical protein VMS94_03410 [Acidobacteriota bacterium]|nr:hypothetical protein [Acidobacteriota bacterium]
MEKKEVKSNENAKPQQQKPQEGVQETPVEEAHFFHPVQLSEESGEVLDEKEIEKSKAEIEQKLQELLKNINEETLQLSEFLMEENKMMEDLCMSLKQVLKKLNVSFSIPPQNIPIRTKINKVILNEEGHLILVHEKGDVNSGFLAEYPPEIVMAVLWTVMPELAKVVMLYRKKISVRVNFFGKVKKELKDVVKAIIGKEGASGSSDDGQAMDAVKESLKSENQS